MEGVREFILFLSANGAWKGAELFTTWLKERKLNNAEADNYIAQANKEVVTSFIQLADELKAQNTRQEERVGRLELRIEDILSRNNELEANKIVLEDKVSSLEARIALLIKDK
ncbi:MAG: hypothetical protein WBA74_17485 [Cyclobacteriaceae bacterium]